jgi:hypothetical protein
MIKRAANPQEPNVHIASGLQNCTRRIGEEHCGPAHLRLLLVWLQGWRSPETRRLDRDPATRAASVVHGGSGLQGLDFSDDEFFHVFYLLSLLVETLSIT